MATPDVGDGGAWIGERGPEIWDTSKTTAENLAASGQTQIGPPVPAEVMAVLRNINFGYPMPDIVLGLIAVRILHAYRPLVLDEVQAALRDPVRYAAWDRTIAWPPPKPWHDVQCAADYLRDTLGAGGEGG